MTTLVLSVEDAEVDKILHTLQTYHIKVIEKKQIENKQDASINAIEKLFAHPLKIVDFQPLKREDIYE